MLAKPNDSGNYPVAMPHSAGASKDRHAQRARPRDSCDALYPVDQSTQGYESEEDTMSILWGDVSMSARHPNRINA